MIKTLATVLCLIVVLATACSQSGTQEEQTTGTETATATETATGSPTTSAPAPAPAAAATITMASMSFGEPVTVSPGAQVVVKNDDSAEHSVTSQTAGVFDVHVDGGQQGTLTAPAQPGEYPFYCIYHPSMKSTLIVQ